MSALTGLGYSVFRQVRAHSIHMARAVHCQKRVMQSVIGNRLFRPTLCTTRKLSSTTRVARLDSSKRGTNSEDKAITAMKLQGNILAFGQKLQKENCFSINLATDPLPTHLFGHHSSIQTIDFHGPRIISASLDSDCKIWNTSGTCLDTLNHDEAKINCIQVEGDLLAVGTNDTTASVWDLITRKRKILAEHTDEISCLSLNNQILATGSLDNTCKIWDLNLSKSKLTIAGHTDMITKVQLTGRKLVTASADKTCMLWDPTITEPSVVTDPIRKFDHDAAITFMQFQQNFLVTVDSNKIGHVWNLAKGEHIRKLDGHKKKITCMQFQGDIVVTGSEDRTCRVWNIKTGNCKPIEFNYVITSIVLRGKLLITGNEDGQYQCLNVPNV